MAGDRRRRRGGGDGAPDGDKSFKAEHAGRLQRAPGVGGQPRGRRAEDGAALSAHHRRGGGSGGSSRFFYH
jgi:hypothetical protein